jgi:hypothetical protein
MTMAERSANGGKPAEARCSCGKRISPMAKRLQDPNPGLQKKCFSCLVGEGKVTVVCW